ncbi:MAG: hypothetical protein KC466_13910, partial [Myxococcales bacterium]|nr:hypothetical protein [Myxococcales bacterium]
MPKVRRSRCIPGACALAALSLSACLSGGSDAGFAGGRDARAGTGPQVVFDVFADSVPDIPFPNDIATRVDFSSPSKLRVNASLVAPTVLEEDVRANLDNLDGWGTFSPITVEFTKTLNIQNILDRHATADMSDDVLYLVDIDPRSRHFGEATPVDLGRGNYPTRIDGAFRDQYFRADPLGFTTSIVFPTYAEDRNGNGVLDPGEDVDFDGELGAPNILRDRATGEPCTAATETDPACDPDLRLIEFYELSSNTLIIRPLVPLRQETRYAVVLTKRLVDYDGQPARSPFAGIHHARQSQALAPLAGVLAAHAGEWGGLGIEDVAFAWTFTTQSVTRDLEEISKGIRGEGAFSWLRDEFPPELDTLVDFGNADELGGGAPYIVLQDSFKDIFGLFSIIQFIGFSIFDFNQLLQTLAAFNDSYNYVDYVVAGSFRTPDFLKTSDEIWKVDRATGRAEVGEDRATFVMTIPRPIPGVCEPPFRTMFYGHGYSVSKLEMLGFGGFYARHCLATIGMDAVGHGPELAMDQLRKDPDQVIPGPGTLDDKILLTIADLVGGLFGLTGEETLANPFLGPFLEALVDGAVQLLAELMYPMLPADSGITLDELKALPLTDMLSVATDTPFFNGILASGRGEDLDGDGFVDSGEKFWTANIFRTRDVVRQGVVDHIQMVEIMEHFDGVRRWKFDTNGDGVANDLAGDFNGDGIVDIGGPGVNYYSMGQSLGAFFSAILPAVDPAVVAAAPVSTGAGLGDISIRTIQGGVVEAVFLEIMGPLIVGGPAELLDPPEGTKSGQIGLAYRTVTPGDVYGAVPAPLEAGRRYVVWDVGVGNSER